MTRLVGRDTEELVAELERLAQELTRRMKDSTEPMKVAFPKRYVRPLWKLRTRWPYLPDDKARTAACTIQLCDVNRWNLNMWNIQWTAGDLCEWQASVPLIALVEMLMVEYTVAIGWTEKAPRTFSDAIAIHQKMGVIGDELAHELEDLRRCRNEVHLFLKEKIDLHDGNPTRYNRAVLALREVEKTLMLHWQNTRHEESPI